MPEDLKALPCIDILTVCCTEQIAVGKQMRSIVLQGKTIPTPYRYARFPHLSGMQV
jgi:hypothetical protein